MPTLTTTTLIPFLATVAVASLSACSSSGTKATDASPPDVDIAMSDSHPLIGNSDTALVTKAETGSETRANTTPDSRTDTVSMADASPGLDTAGKDTLAPDTSSTATETGVCTGTDIQLIGNQILDQAGTRIIARGPEMVVASLDNASGIDTAGTMGANAARFLLTLDVDNGMTPTTFDTLLNRAVANKMIVWVSLYTWKDNANNPISTALGGGNFYQLTAPDGTGTCSRETPVPCYLAVWSRQWAKDLMTKYKGHVILDAMQEYIGIAKPDSEAGQTEWANAAKLNISWFRANGYTNPLEIMSNFQGRDLYAIFKHANDIRAADTLKVNGHSQTMFGWQAYWISDWYKSWQGELLLGPGKTITAANAINQIVATRTYPIQVGFDNYANDASTEYTAMIDQAATDKVSWLWWSWAFGSHNVDCPVSGATCQNTVTKSTNGFAGAVKSVCGM